MKRPLTPYEVLRRPIVTEKATDAVRDRNTWAFEVDPLATRGDIRSAVQAIYGVRVRRVNTSVRAGKPRRFRRAEGASSERKIAWVTLEKGQMIDVF